MIFQRLKKTSIKKVAQTTVLGVVTVVCVMNGGVAQAISQSDLNSIINNTPFTDPNAIVCTQGDATVAAQPASLTTDQEIAQTLLVGFSGDSSVDNIKSIVQTYKPGGVAFTDDVNTAVLDSAFFNALNISDSVDGKTSNKMFIAADDEGGQVATFNKSAPSANTMNSMTNDQVKAQGQATGKALATAGLTADLAPVLDIKTPGTVWTKTERDWSSDTSEIISKVGSFAEGLQASNIIPVYKHFPGIGKVTGNTDKSTTTPQTLASMSDDLKPYQALANKNNGAIMLSNGFITEWGSTTPVSINPKAVEYIRKSLNFTGVITTDDLRALNNYGAQAMDIPTAVAAALNAGVDMPLFIVNAATADSTVAAVIAAVKAAVPADKIHAAYLNDAKLRGISTAVTTSATSSESSASAGGQNTLDGYKLPAYSGQTGREEAVNVNGQVASTGAKVSFSNFAKLGQSYRDYYITMRWTFASWSWQGNSKIVDSKQEQWFAQQPRLVVVTNPKTGKSIIADVMESGPGPSVGSTWRAQHNNSSAETAPYWPGFQTGTPTEFDGLVAGMPPVALSALGLSDADVDAGYRSGNGGTVVPLQYAWAPDQSVSPGPTNESAGAATTSTNTDGSNSCCVTNTTPTVASTVLSGSDNVAKVMKYLMDKGLSVAGAAGAVGNLQVESGAVLKPNIQEGGADHAFPQGGWGIAQWTGERRPGLISAIKAAGLERLYTNDQSAALDLSPADNDALLAVELNYLWSELQASYGGTLDAAKAATDPSAAAYSWENSYEGCTPYYSDADCSVPARESNAVAIFASYSDTAAVSGTTTTAPDTNTTPTGVSGSTVTANTSDSTGCEAAADTSTTGTGFTGTLLSYAWPSYIRSADGGTKQMPGYTAAVKVERDKGAYIGDANVTGDGYPYGGDDCSAFVSIFMVNSGYDTTFKRGYTVPQGEWLAQNWQKVGVTGSMDVADFRPGDVIINPGEHVYMFVGDIPGFNAKFASASSGTEGLELRAPMAAHEDQNYGAGQFIVYRKKTAANV